MTRASVLTVKFKKAQWTRERVALEPLWNRKLTGQGRGRVAFRSWAGVRGI